MNGELTKKQKTMNEEESMTFLNLPNDLVLNILARVSRLHYPTLSLVSKRLRFLLSSPEIYQIRKFLVCTENCLYVCLRRPTYTSPVRLFVLGSKPNSSKKVLVPITSPNYTYDSGIVSVGSYIYSIGGSINSYDQASSRVMVLDCYSNTWREASNIRIAREITSVCVLDGKIYVTGGCKNLDASNWMEVFDTKTQTWEFKLCGNSEKVCNGYNRHKSIAYDGTVYVNCLDTFKVHKLDEGSSWIREEDLTMMSKGWPFDSSACVISACVIRNVLYACTIYGIICWYDSEAKEWKDLKGLEITFGYQPTLADSGGKLAICWKETGLVNGRCLHERRIYEIKIWCATIAIVKCHGGEICGTLECSDIVFTTSDEQLDITHLLAVTL